MWWRPIVWAMSSLVNGLSAPALLLEPHIWRNCMGLTVKDGDANPADGVEDAWARLGDGKGRMWHDFKNLSREWTELDPRRAVKFYNFVIVVLLMILFSSAAFAHSWYDYTCCSNRDCYPLPEEAVLEEQSNGDYLVRWVSPLSGKVIEGRVVKRNVKDTRDGQIHGCERSDGLPRCIYIHRGV